MLDKINETELINNIANNINIMKQNIITLDAERKKAKELKELLQFYIGNETIQIDMTMKVNLHKIKTEQMLVTKISSYRKLLDEKINKTTEEIEMYGNLLQKCRIK